MQSSDRTALTIVLSVILLAAGCRGDSAGSPPPGAETRIPDKTQIKEAPSMKPTKTPTSGNVGTLPPDVGIAVGQPAPDALLRDAAGVEVRLRDLVAKGPVVLFFYRGGWCPFCNFQIHEMTEAYPELEKRGVTPVAVSVDRIDEAAKTQATYTIPFPVLSDPDLAAHRAFRVTHEAPDAEVEMLRGFGMDLEKASGRDHHTIAIPSVFIIDREGIVRWGHADRDYKVRPSTAQLVSAIDALRLPGTSSK